MRRTAPNSHARFCASARLMTPKSIDEPREFNRAPVGDQSRAGGNGWLQGCNLPLDGLTIRFGVIILGELGRYKQGKGFRLSRYARQPDPTCAGLLNCHHGHGPASANVMEDAPAGITCIAVSTAFAVAVGAGENVRVLAMCAASMSSLRLISAMSEAA